MSEPDLRRLLQCTKDCRQLRLFAVACCRNIWHLLTDQRSKDAVEVAEQFADGLVSEEELSTARVVAWDAAWDASRAVSRAAGSVAWGAENSAGIAARYAARAVAWTALSAALSDAGSIAWAAAWNAAWAAALDTASDTSAKYTSSAAWDAVRQQQLVSLQDIVCKPTIEFNQTLLSWNSSLLAKFATNIYTNKDFNLMPILADALEEANAPIAFIQHCREEVHAKGCWGLDVLIGKR